MSVFKMKLVVSFICVFFLASFQSGHCAKVIFTDVPDDIINNIFIYLIKGPNITDNVKLSIEDGLTFMDNDFFFSGRETVFYMHGWGENANRESVVTIANAFIQKNFTNLAIFDYSVLVKADNDTEYLESFINASYIGCAIGQYLQQYVPAVQSLDKVHLISHSLGSQIMSKTATTYDAGMLPWLTGLDPAGPLYNIPGVSHLQASDAVFVDVIHTDGGFLGDYRSIGTVNLFPNRGTRIQPKCANDTIDLENCNHHMSWRYYAESILNSTAFPSRRCYRNSLCDSNLSLCDCSIYKGQFTYIGYTVDKSAVGDFYLWTGSESPYGKGDAGMNF